VQAAICSRFGVAWHRYGSLTLREFRVLLSMVAEENDDDTALSGPVDRSTPAPPAPPAPPATRTGKNGERLERVC
jgi:hypothetical protein